MTDVALQTAEKRGSTCRRSGVAPIAPGLEEAHDSLLDERAFDAVSADEISEMVSGALQDAILAAAKPCHQTYLSFLDGRKREAIIARMNHLPFVQLTHPVVQAEVLKEFAMISGQRKLANGIVESICTYARSK